MRDFLILALVALFLCGFGTGFVLSEDRLLDSCEEQARVRTLKDSMDLFVQRDLPGSLRHLESLNVCAEAKPTEEVLKAQLSYSLGLKEAAKEYSDHAIAMNPFSAEAFAIRGQIYYEQKKFLMALQDLDRANELAPGSEELEKTRYATLFELGMAPKAPVPEERGPANSAVDPSM